jgi:hypothetical protein
MKKAELKYSPEHIAKALRKERLGGVCWINICGAGETLIQDEVIDIMMVSIDEVLKMIDENKIKDAKTICLIHKYLRYINKKIL